MKKSLIMVIIIQLAIFSLFTGCEEGLNAGNDSGSSSEGTGFSFSDMYSKFSKLQEEVDRVRQENEELKAVIEALTGDSLDTSNSLTTRISDLESSVATLEGMNSTFAGVTRLTDSETGQPTIRFSGVNVQIVNGLGFTNGVDDNSDSAGTVNGLGNLIVGYNKRTGGYDTKSGSHNIIVGSHHYYSSYGGLVVGYSNYMSGKYSSVSGGSECRAINDYSSVSGGRNNFANGDYSSVKGGWANWATGEYSSINGGWQCQASGNRSTVSGGQRRGASGAFNWRGGDYSSEF